MEIFGFAREMSGQTAQLVGQMQDQNQNQINLIVAQAEAYKQEALKREEAQRTEAIRREEMSLAREQMMAKIKADTEEASLRREQALRQEKVDTEQALRKEKTDAEEATRKREQLYLEHELKRQKVMVEANTILQQERIKTGVHREVAWWKQTPFYSKNGLKQTCIGKLLIWRPLREGRQNFVSSRRGSVNKLGTPNLNCVSWQPKNSRKEYSSSEN